MRWSFVIAGLVIAAAIVGGYLWWDAQPQSDEAPDADAPPSQVPTEPPSPREIMGAEPPTLTPDVTSRPAPPPIELPALNDSDGFLRDQLGDEPEGLMAEWLQQEDLLRRAAVVLHNATRGEYPKRQLAFVPVRGPFKVRVEDERMFVDEASYERYDDVVRAATSLEPEHVADLLELVEPLLNQALRELGVRKESDSAIADAVAMIMDTPVIEEPVEVVRPEVLYQFADERLEALAPIQKQLLRMGPENVKRVQAYAARVYEELSLTR